MVDANHPGAEPQSPDSDEALMLAIATHHEATAAALRQMVDGRGCPR